MNALPKSLLEETAPSEAESILMKIPLLGWSIAHALEINRFRPIIEYYENILSARDPNQVVASWSEEEYFIAQPLMKILEEELGWKNALFIPTDPCVVAIWAHQDGLDDVAAFQSIEHTWGIQFTDEDLHKIAEFNLRDFVALIKTRSQQAASSNP